jgi:hypothetical protein
VAVTVLLPEGLAYTLLPAFTYQGNGTTNGTVPPTSTPTGGVPISAAQIAAANKAVQVTVTRSGSDNKVDFTLPSGLPAAAAGVQVFRSTSPFALVATLGKGDAAFTSRSFLDVGAPATAKYVVTVFYGKGAGQGYCPETSCDPATIPGFGDLGGAQAPAKSDLVWYLLISGMVLVAIVLVIILVVRARRPLPP